MRKDLFVWTEAFNCGEILNPMVSSYLKHNNQPLNIFATEEDFKHLTITSNLILKHNLDSVTLRFISNENLESKILNDYQNGHKGTSRLWSYIIKSNRDKYLLHIDADTIILADVISDLYSAIKNENYSIAGSRRPYKMRTYRLSETKLDSLPDLVNTDCFIFDPRKISIYPSWYLRRKIFGKRPILHPSIDFFDPISFEIIRKKGRIKYMDSEIQNSVGLTNMTSNFMTKRISFAAVGSGLNFYKNKNTNVPEGYKKFALSSYSLFAQYVLKTHIPIPPLENNELIEKLKRLDIEEWELTEDKM
jgi:hypothetical protein